MRKVIGINAENGLEVHSVPGHASFLSTTDPTALPFNAFAAENDGHWYLQPFQKRETPFYAEHLRAAVRKALERQVASTAQQLVVLSGGFTRPKSVSGGTTQWSEAGSYLAAFGTDPSEPIIDTYDEVSFTASNGEANVRLAMVELPNGLLLPGGDYTARGSRVVIALDEYARSSGENVIGTVATARALGGGRLPDDISFYGWGFKRPPFLTTVNKLNIRERTTYVGVNNPTNPYKEGVTDKIEPGAVSEGSRKTHLGESVKKLAARDPLRRGNPFYSFVDRAG